MMKPATLQFYKERMLRALVFIQENLDRPPALREIAARACLAPHHFHHVFTGMIGESLAAHIRRLRLERAASRLRTTAQPVTQIAFDAGYETHEAFTRAFRAAFGAAPSQFRRSHAAEAMLRAPSRVHYRGPGRLRDFRVKQNPIKPMNVSIQSIAPMRVAFMRHVGPYNEAGATWGRLMMLLGKDGWLGGEAQFIGVCHDDPAVTGPEKLRYDACLTVDASFQPSGDIGAQTIAGGDYAVATHFGPYEKLGDTYAKLMGQWLPRSGRVLGLSPSFEKYFNSPQDTEPGDLITDIHIPLV